MLRVRCERVQNPKSAATRLVADDLRDSLAIARKKYKMGRALAAPQIGAPVRIVFVQTDKQRWTMINPEITDVGGTTFWYGRLLLVSQPAGSRQPRLPDHGELYRSQG